MTEQERLLARLEAVRADLEGALERDDYWAEEGTDAESAAEAFARMTPAEQAADRRYGEGKR